jgi:hypothetical protein
MMNPNKQDKTVDGGRFAERTNGFTSATNVVSGATIPDLKTLRIPAQTAWVLELKR